MKKLLLMALFALACGGEADDAGLGSDIGQLQQALTSIQGYGKTQNFTSPSHSALDGGCYLDNANSVCRVPNDKVFHFKVTTTPWPAGWWDNAWLPVLNDARAAAGPAWTIDNGGTDNAESINFSFTGDTIAEGGAYGSHTDSSLSTVQTIGGRKFQFAGRCKMNINVNAVDDHPAGWGWPEYWTRVRNILRHELGHCLGLAHKPSGIMHAAAQNFADAGVDIGYSQESSIWLYGYVR